MGVLSLASTKNLKLEKFEKKYYNISVKKKER